MSTFERRKLIINYLRDKNRFVTVEQLCDAMYVSGATIRRDLKELEASHLIRRARGGAMLVEGGNSEDPIIFREEQNTMAKQIIAGLAVRHVQDGMTLFMDSSSTVFALARIMDRFSNIRVVTTGLKTALLLSEYKCVTVMCTGGHLRENSKSLVGQSAVEYIKKLTADISFMSCRGFSMENGASEGNEEEYYIKRQFLQNSKQSFLLCDTTKMNIDYLYRTAPLSRFKEVITEKREINALCTAPDTVSSE